MDSHPSFHLRNVAAVLSSTHGNAQKSAPHHLAGSRGTGTPQPATSRDARIAEWAGIAGKAGSPADFQARLAGRQVGAELLNIFRETPEFGRSLALRIDPFLDESTQGLLRLFGGGGEAIVFFDEARQLAIKLLAPPGKGGFGWVFCRNEKNRWAIRSGGLAEAVQRFARFEEWFDSGLELDQIGTCGDFLVLSQPFIAGSHPDVDALHEWMRGRGWEPWSPPTDLAMIADLSWRKGEAVVTDVRPENALVSDSGDVMIAIDFIAGIA